MKFAIFNSVPEVLLYVLLILVLALNIIGLRVTFDNAQQAKSLAAQNQKLAAENQANTILIKNQVSCIAGFFFFVSNRTNSSISTLSSQPDCAATIKEIE